MEVCRSINVIRIPEFIHFWWFSHNVLEIRKLIYWIYSNITSIQPSEILIWAKNYYRNNHFQVAFSIGCHGCKFEVCIIFLIYTVLECSIHQFKLKKYHRQILNRKIWIFKIYNIALILPIFICMHFQRALTLTSRLSLEMQGGLLDPPAMEFELIWRIYSKTHLLFCYRHDKIVKSNIFDKIDIFE